MVNPPSFWRILKDKKRSRCQNARVARVHIVALCGGFTSSIVNLNGHAEVWLDIYFHFHCFQFVVNQQKLKCHRKNELYTSQELLISWHKIKSRATFAEFNIKNSCKTTFPHIFFPVMSMPPPAKTPKALLKMADQVPSVAGIQCPAGNLGTGRIVNDIVKTR